ncbi:MAG: dihydroorotate dehydrogenase electron transfer subunit [Phycisphaerae bacterium]|nr:dihydroorotate dehydrogenase electron transfer subunit [Phycisphaerae bacterium]
MNSCSCNTKPEDSRRLLAATVVGNAAVCDEHHRLTLRTLESVVAHPGQFLQLRCKRLAPRELDDSETTARAIADSQAKRQEWAEGPVLLPRPFSLAGLRSQDDRSEFDIIYRTVGPGTAWMAGLVSGDTVQALGPLGNRFDIPDRPLRAYVVVGGVGLPPMIWLAEHLRVAGHQTTAFCGAKTARLMALALSGAVSTDPTAPSRVAEEFSRSDVPVVLTTDDGSLGVRGLVGAAMDAYHAAHPCPSDQVVVYTCGPEPMMAAVARWCFDREIRCQVCMERMMACGIGTCQSCVVAVHDETSRTGFRYKLCCTDGPVFDAREIIWDRPVPRSAYTPPY